MAADQLSPHDAVERALAAAHRHEWAVVLAATARVTRDLDLAEECVQDAYAQALGAWEVHGVPENPGAWLTTTARRRAIDAVRRRSNLAPKLALLVDDIDDSDVEEGEPVSVADERLRLIFMCCHPSIATESSAALTLRLICGIPTSEIAQVFLVSDTTMAARLTRAKRKIAIARIPVRVPRAEELTERLTAVLSVLHLLLTMGHAAPSGPALMRVDLADESLHLARTLHELMPDEAEVRALLALVLVTNARRDARVDSDGRLVELAGQDRSSWNHEMIAEGSALADINQRAQRRGRYQLQAEIALCHALAPTSDATDWSAILALYDDLLAVWPSPVVALNRTVALSVTAGPTEALAALERLEANERLAVYHYLWAVKADFLMKLGRRDDAVLATERALACATNDTERTHLLAVLEERSRS